MKILISKANEALIKNEDKKIKFEEKTKSTSSFTISINNFSKLSISLKSKGYNPYALFYVMS